jgi:FixJ family two-component response regulator
MGQLVRSFDLAVELYASGQALLQSASIGHIRCVVSDVRMPGIDGFALCTRCARSGSMCRSSS